MKILVSSDFYYDYELIEAPDILSAERYIIDCLNYNEPDDDIILLETSDTLTTEEAKSLAEHTLFISDYIHE